MKEAFEQLDRRFQERGGRTGVTSGFHDIDDRTTGFQPTNFIIVAARPGMGKTSFALNAAVAAARESVEGGSGAPIAFFSLEMSKDELVQRLISAEARLSMHDMRRGNIKPHQWEDISRAMAVLHELPLYLDDTGALTVTEIRSRCRRLKSRHGLGAVFVDYIQLLRPSTLSRTANRNEELSEICRTLKITAKDLGVPIIALAQLNRGVEARSDKRPMLADLRDSGSLEQEADMVAFLYRDDYYNRESAPEPGVAEFIMAKHRNGPTGMVKLRFEEQYTRFLPYADETHFPAPP
jgi:replicative DNA helicase